MAAFAARGDSLGMNCLAELDDGDEAVAAGAVDFPRAFVRPRGEGCERAPGRRRKFYGDTWPSISERVDDVVSQSLEPIDVAPRCLPFSEISCELVGRGRQGGDKLLRFRAR